MPDNKSLRRFIPDGYCDFWAMRRAVYMHLYPRPQDDSELIELLSVAKSDARLEIDSSDDEAETLPKPRGGGIGNSANQQRMMYALRSYIAAGALKNVGELLSDIEENSFDPLVTLIDAQIANSGAHSLGASLGKKRWDEMQRLMREHLFAGSLQVFGPSINGLVAFPSGHAWIDDQYASGALESGTAAPVPDSDPVVRLEMLFLTEEVSALFPRFSNQQSELDGTSMANAKKIGRPRKVGKFAAWLKDNYPHGKPNDITVKELMRIATDAIGEEIQRDAFRDARKTAWPEKGS